MGHISDSQGNSELQNVHLAYVCVIVFDRTSLLNCLDSSSEFCFPVNFISVLFTVYLVLNKNYYILEHFKLFVEL